jgi:hypothetical protein
MGIFLGALEADFDQVLEAGEKRVFVGGFRRCGGGDAFELQRSAGKSWLRFALGVHAHGD